MVSISDLSHSFDDTEVLRNITLEVADGEIMAIMGSSGGGKTTLLRCISGLIVPTEGRILVDSVDVKAEPDTARRRMGMVFQSAALFDYMNVEANVLFGIQRQLDLEPSQRHELVRRSLDRVGMEPEDATKMPAELSGGMRKRVGIARALALSPKVMLYDEPTTGLDPITTYTIDRLIVSIRKERNMTSLLVSHDVSSVMRVADRIAFLHHGELIFQGTPQEFEESDEESIQELMSKARATSFASVD